MNENNTKVQPANRSLAYLAGFCIAFLCLFGCSSDTRASKEEVHKYLKVDFQQTMEQIAEGEVTITILNRSPKLIFKVEALDFRTTRSVGPFFQSTEPTTGSSIEILKVVQPHETCSYTYAVESADTITGVYLNEWYIQVSSK